LHLSLVLACKDGSIATLPSIHYWIRPCCNLWLGTYEPWFKKFKGPNTYS
jgi:hypothetical protein